MSAAATAPLLLVSASPRRRELLVHLGLSFDTAVAAVDETPRYGEAPRPLAIRLARAKADAVAVSVPPGPLLIGADTVVSLGRRTFGKPADAAEAASMLRALRGREHAVMTAVAILDTESGELTEAAPETAVHLRDYSDAEIAASIAAGTPFDKAGAYAIQDDAFRPVARYEGCYCNVMGLPLWTVRSLLSRLRPGLAVARPDAERAVCRACPLGS